MKQPSPTWGDWFEIDWFLRMSTIYWYVTDNIIFNGKCILHMHTSLARPANTFILEYVYYLKLKTINFFPFEIFWTIHLLPLINLYFTYSTSIPAIDIVCYFDLLATVTVNAVQLRIHREYFIGHRLKYCFKFQSQNSVWQHANRMKSVSIVHCALALCTCFLLILNKCYRIANHCWWTYQVCRRSKHERKKTKQPIVQIL